MALKSANLQWSDDGILRSRDFNDIYFQPGQGMAESRYVFLEQNNISQRFQTLTKNTDFYIAELGFGTGLNFLLTATLFQEQAPDHTRMTYVSFEKHPITEQDLQKIYKNWTEFSDLTQKLLQQYPPFIEGFHHLHFGPVRLMLVFGDIKKQIRRLSGQFDAWYLDGFAPDKNPEMWHESLFPLIATRTRAGGTVSSFSAAGQVRRGLETAGFDVHKTKGFGRKRDMTVAALNRQATDKKSVPKRAIVLGAGLAGCAAAYALARRGIKVDIIDRCESFAKETSGNPVGVMYPKLTIDRSPMGVFHAHGFCYTRSIIPTLNIPSWKNCGVLHLHTNKNVKTRFDKILAAGIYPQDMAVEKGGGLFQSCGGIISPPELCRYLLDHPNIKTVFSKTITALPKNNVPVIIALGMESERFKQTDWLPLQSLRGQISFVRSTQASEKIDHVICHEGYITPAENGMHCIGATFQREPVSRPEIRDADHAENINNLQKYLPDLGLSGVTGGRTGYRVTTPDKLPLIGALPDHAACLDMLPKDYNESILANISVPHIKNLYISTGFGAHGLSGAVLAGEIIAAEINDDPAPVPKDLLAELLPERFIFRDLKRKAIHCLS